MLFCLVYFVLRAPAPSRSPDSVLKLKFCPQLPFFTNSSSLSDRTSFYKSSRGEYHDQRKQLLSNSSPPPHYTLFESHLGSQAPSPAALESISRGPDGRFIVQPLPAGSSPSSKNHIKKDDLLSNGGPSGSGSNRTSLRDSPKSSILSSEKSQRKDSPLTVDVPELSRPPSSPGRVRAMARNFSRHGCFYSDDEQGSEALLERASFYSDNSEKKNIDSLKRHRMLAHTEDLFPSLGRKTKRLDRDRPQYSGYHPVESQLTNDSTLVSQLDSELERESINKCVQLAKEREEIERELKSFTAEHKNRGCGRDERQSNRRDSPLKDAAKSDNEAVWKPQDVTIRQKHRPSGQTSRVSDYRKACYFGNTSSPMDQLPSTSIQWDISPVTSLTSLIPVQTPKKTTSPRSHYPRMCRKTSEDCLAVDSSCSPVTQDTSLSMLSPDVTVEGHHALCLETPVRDRSPQKKTDTCRKSPMDQCLDGKIQGGGVSPAHAGTQPSDSAAGSPPVDRETPQSSASTTYNQPDGTAEENNPALRDLSPSNYSTLPFESDETEAKAKDRETRGQEDRRGSGVHCELEKEGVRTGSRRSDKCLFSDSPSPISTLTLVEEVESDHSQFSVPRMSESFKAKPAAQSPKSSSLQTSAILEYLSLPGFIEMSVDEPMDEAEVTETAGQGSESKAEKSLVAKPDVVPKNWEVHVQENRKKDSKHKVCFEKSAAEESTDLSRRQDLKRPLLVESRDSSLRVSFPDETAPEKTSRQLYEEKALIRAGNKSTERPESRLGSRSAHTLFSAARGMVDIVSKHSQSFVDSNESLSEPAQRPAPQASRVNNIASRICQAPVPFLKKSLSMGPCRTLSGMGQPRPFLKKSISLGSQRWEHFESPRTYISEKSYWDEFPSPDVRVKSYSLGHTPSSLPRPGPSWREYVPFRRPSMGSLERPHHAQRSLASPSYLAPSAYPLRQTSVSPMPEPGDPRRQTTVFPESSRWSPSYHETLRSAQHKYVPMSSNFPAPQYQHWPGSREESMRPMDPRRGPPRSYLPRGISWPSPYYAPFPPREGDWYRQPDRLMGRGGDPEIREGGRTSYASQSSGRGSAGLFRQSLSITPTLLSSPETTEESERHRADTDLPERRAKRWNTWTVTTNHQCLGRGIYLYCQNA